MILVIKAKINNMLTNASHLDWASVLIMAVFGGIVIIINIQKSIMLIILAQCHTDIFKVLIVSVWVNIFRHMPASSASGDDPMFVIVKPELELKHEWYAEYRISVFLVYISWISINLYYI